VPFDDYRSVAAGSTQWLCEMLRDMSAAAITAVAAYASPTYHSLNINFPIAKREQ
jgi:hypothetical protein